MLRILIVGLTGNIGGMETFFHNFYEKLKQKFQFDFVAVDGELAFLEEYIKDGARIHSVPNPKKHPLGYRRMLKKILKTNRYDVVHINMLSAANILPIKLAKKANVSKTIVHAHNTGIPNGLLRKLLHNYHKKSLKSKNLTRLACSEVAGKWLFGEDTEFRVLNNAMDPKRYQFSQKSRQKIRKKYGLKPADFVLGNVGRVSEQKNQEFLIEIENRLKEYPDIKLLLVGGGDLQKLRQRIIHLGLEKQVILTDAVNNPQEFYSAFDLFVLPSKFEGLALAPIEAQLSGLSCLMSDKISQQIVFTEKTAFLPISDVGVWVEKIKELSRQRPRRYLDLKKFQTLGYDITHEFNRLAKIYNPDIKISIIVPAYNAEKYIAKCLTSLVNQTYENLEIIVVNDGSTDSTEKIVGQFLYDDRVKYISQSNQGANVARGTGIKHAVGDYCIFVDSDDWVEPYAVEIAVEKLDNRSYDVIKFEPQLHQALEFDPRSNFGKQSLILDAHFRSLWSGVYSIELLKTSFAFDQRSSYAEDYLANLEICSRANKILVAQGDFYHYRRNAGSTTIPTDKHSATKNMREGFAAFEKVAETAKSWRVDDAQVGLMLLDDAKWLIYGFSRTDIVRGEAKKMISTVIDSGMAKQGRKKLTKTELANLLKSRSLPYRLKHASVIKSIYAHNLEAVYRQYLWHRLISKIRRAA